MYIDWFYNVPVKLAASAIRNVVHDSKKNKAVSRRGKSEILVSFVTCNRFSVKDYNILLANSCHVEYYLTIQILYIPVVPHFAKHFSCMVVKCQHHATVISWTNSSPY